MSRTLRFTKMHGAGNDYVVLDGIRQELPPIPPLAAQLCDRILASVPTSCWSRAPRAPRIFEWRSTTPTAAR